jgi:hypothetical protein
MHQQTVPILSEDVFTILGDKQSIEILESASAGMRSSSNGIRNQSKKQYYVRLKRLVEMGDRTSTATHATVCSRNPFPGIIVARAYFDGNT